MLELRRSAERGHAQHGWLDSYHSFSFAGYHDPRHMGFGPLRVINEDRVLPGMGFGMHGHRDMEILSYVLSGRLEHRDSMGNGSLIAPGEVQRLTAGTGLQHSEYNPSREEPVHFLQVWIEPSQRGLAPGYEQARLPEAASNGRLLLIAGPPGDGGAVTIHQDARVYAARLDGDDVLEHALAPGRRAYVHVVRGTVDVNGEPLAAGDAAKLTGEKHVRLGDAGDAEVMLFDLP